MATNYLKSLLGEEEYESTRKQALNAGLLNAGLQMLASSGPSVAPPSVASGLGMAGMAGLQGYQGALQGAERQALRGMELAEMQGQQAEQEEFKRASADLIKNGKIDYNAAFDLAVRFPKQATSVLNALNLAKPPAGPGPVNLQFDPKTGTIFNPRTGEVKRMEGFEPRADFGLDSATKTFAQNAFGTADFGSLTPEQQAIVIQYKNAPTDKDYGDLLKGAQDTFFQTGVMPSVPMSRTQILQNVTGAKGVGDRQQAPQGETAVSAADRVNLPVDMLVKPMGEREVPLIESQGISPKQKQELTLQQPQQTAALEATVDTARSMKNAAQELLNHPGLGGAVGMTGAIASNIPGSAWADFSAKLQFLKDRSFVAAIQAMREASKTGGAVGNITEAEGKRFENAFAALERAQSEPQIKKELANIVKLMEEMEARSKNAYRRVYGVVPEVVVRPTQSGQGGLPPGVTVRRK